MKEDPQMQPTEACGAAPPEGACTQTRWAAFEAAVLSKVSNPQKCLETILRRQQEVDDETTESDLVAEHFREVLRDQKCDPDTCCVYWTTAEMANMLNAAIGVKTPINKVTPFLRILAIPELKYSKKDGKPGWVWRGAKAKPNQSSAVFAKLKCLPPGDEEDDSDDDVKASV